MNASHISSLFINLIMIVAVGTLGAAPGASVHPVYAQDDPPGGEALPAELAEGTPFQQEMKNALAERSSQGLPTPDQVEYTIDVVEQTSQHTLVSGRTEIRYGGPQEAGYDRWPEFRVDEQAGLETGARVQVEVEPGEYDQAVMNAVAAQHPSAWTAYEYGYEPRTLVVWETYEIIGEGQVQESLETAGQPGLASVSTDDSILFGFTFTGPDVHYSYSEEWKFLGVTLARFTIQFNLDWGLGLRMPFAVGLDGPYNEFLNPIEEVFQGTSFYLSSDVDPRDWNADQYVDAGAPAEKGNEFVLFFIFQLSARLWVTGVGDVLVFTEGPAFDYSFGFTPPFLPGNFTFPLPPITIDPNQTNLRWPKTDNWWLGIGIRLSPEVTIKSEIKAKWRAEGDATGGGDITYTGDQNQVAIGPITAADISPEDVARVRLYDFLYEFSTTKVDIAGIIYLQYGDVTLPIPIGIPIGSVTFSKSLWTHPGTDRDVVIELPIENPLQVEKTADRTVVRPGVTVNLITRVTNHGEELLENVVLNDSHCGVHNLGSLAKDEIKEVTCQVNPTADLGSFATATSSGSYSDSASVYISVLDGIVGDGTPASCSEAALDAELFNPAGSVIRFNCGPDPHAISLTSSKVIPRSLEIIGAGLITLAGQTGMPDHTVTKVRLFTVPARKTLTLRGLILANGWVKAADGEMTPEVGGAVENFGTLTLEDCQVLNNSADRGGGIYNHAAARLILRRTLFKGNQAFESGGALYNASQAAINASLFSSNTAVDKGGAIINTVGGSLGIYENTILDHNTANYGGGLGNYEQARASIFNSLLTQNTAQILGGAIANYGGGVLTIDSSEISANQAVAVEYTDFAPGGGGVYNEPEGQVVLRRSMIYQNSANVGAGILNQGSMTVDSSTFSDNFAIKDGGGGFNTGVLMVKRSTFGGPVLADGNRAISGGALVNWSPTGQLTITNSLIQNNQADNGGALDNDGGAKLVVQGTQLIDNIAHVIGGAIVNYGSSPVELFASILSGNQAGDGGGIYNYQDGAILIGAGCSISDNRADQRGGGIYNTAGVVSLAGAAVLRNQVGDDSDKGAEETGLLWAGGGIYNQSGQVLATNSIIAENQAGEKGAGGGIFNDTGSLNLQDTHVDNNLVGYYGLGGGIHSRNGDLELTNSTVDRNTILSAGSGAGLFVFEGNVRLSASSVSYNQALKLANTGGIYNEKGHLILESSLVIGNLAESDGGGICNASGYLEISNSRIEKNTSTGMGASGGGILNRGGDVDLINSIVSSNRASGASAAYGGGIYNTGYVHLLSSDVSKNYIDGDYEYLGGGIYNNGGDIYMERSSLTKNTAFGQAGGKGGGLYTEGGSVYLSNSTISGNRVEYQSQGGGIYHAGDGGLLIGYTTITGNLAYFGGGIFGKADIYASILSGNTAVVAGTNCAEGLTSAGWNVENGNTCQLTQATDLIDTNPLLNPVSTCGITHVHTLLEGSPARDHIPAVECDEVVDQCGNPRPLVSGKSCDVGAFEAPE